MENKQPSNYFSDKLKDVLIVFLGYFLGALLGQFLTEATSYTATIWPPSGILLSAFLMSEKRRWPYYILAAFIANISFDLINNRQLTASIFFTIGNIAEAVTGAYLINKIIKYKFDLTTNAQLITLLTISLFSTMISSTMGYMTGRIILDVDISWIVWWSGDIAGILIFTPLIITFKYRSSAGNSENIRARVIEITGLIIAILLIYYIAFISEAENYHSIEFLILLPMLWAAIRFERYITAFSSLIIGGISLWATSHGFGPFRTDPGDINTAVYSFQLFIGGSIFLALFISILIKEKSNTIKLLNESESRLREAQKVGGIGNWEYDKQSGNIKYYARLNRLFEIGSSESEMALGRFLGYYSAEDAEVIKRNLEECIISGRTWKYEAKAKLQSGRDIWHRHIGTGLINSEGTIEIIYGITQDITERKQTEEELRESETHFRTIADSGQALIWTSDTNKKCNYFNQPWLDFTGQPLEHELGDGWASGVHPDDLDYCFNTFVTAFDRREKFIMEYRILHHSGEYRWIEDFGSPRYDSRGEFLGYIGHCLDISKRKHVESELHKNLKLLDNTFSSLNEAVIIVEPINRTIVSCNKATEKIFGYSIEELRNRNTSLLHINSESYEHFGYVSLISLKESGVFNCEFTMKKKDGTLINTENTITGITDEHGVTSGYVSVVRDITERKRAENSLKESEERFKLLLNSAAEAIYGIDINGNCTFCNTSALKILGYESEAELIGKNMHDVIHHSTAMGEPIIQERCHIYQAFQKGIGTHIEDEVLWRSDGTSFDAEYWSFPMKRDKEVVGAVVTFFDITERKRTEEELNKYRNHLEELVETRTAELDAINANLMQEIELKLKAEHELEEALEKERQLSKLMSRFISTASHEFRTPLTSIMTSIELIQRYGEKWSVEKRNDYIEKIKSAVDYLTGLMNDILDISRTNSGKSTLNTAPTDLYNLCQNVLEEIGLQTKSQHEIIFNYSVENRSFTLDQKQVYTILQNLLSNAVKYSPSGGKIELTITTSGENIALIVKDEGIGIPDEDLPRLFQPFERATNIEEIRGTGLGLAIVKNAVELHKGRIKVESKMNFGSKFIVEIPLTNNFSSVQ